jgi:small subunit ribosomal protein S6
MRQYELMFVVDPRVPDEDVVAMTDEYKKMIEGHGAVVTREQSWGKRKLAYPIAKVTEGKYQLLNVQAEAGVNPFPEVEQRLEQNESVLRFLTVRIDTGRLSLEPSVADEVAEQGAGGEEA